MNISLPEALRDFVEKRVSEGGHGSSSEYVRELIRRDRDREQLKLLLLEGARSAPGAEMNADYFALLRQRAAGKARKAKQA